MSLAIVMGSPSERGETKMENQTQKEISTIVFGNRPPIRILKENIKCIKDFNQDFGHDKIYLVHSPRIGKYILYTSQNSGRSYGNHSPETSNISLGVFDTKEELILFLRKGVCFSPETNEMDFQTSGEILEEIGGVEDF